MWFISSATRAQNLFSFSQLISNRFNFNCCDWEKNTLYSTFCSFLPSYKSENSVSIFSSVPKKHLWSIRSKQCCSSVQASRGPSMLKWNNLQPWPCGHARPQLLQLFGGTLQHTFTLTPKRCLMELFTKLFVIKCSFTLVDFLNRSIQSLPNSSLSHIFIWLFVDKSVNRSHQNYSSFFTFYWLTLHLITTEFPSCDRVACRHEEQTSASEKAKWRCVLNVL